MGVSDWYRQTEAYLEEYVDALGTGSHLAGSDPDIDQYLDVETENAQYIQYTGIPAFGYISSSVEDEVIAESDAIVLQNTTPYEDLDLDDLLDERYGPIVEQNLEQADPHPIYVVDLPSESLTGQALEFLSDRPVSLGRYGGRAAQVFRPDHGYMTYLPAGGVARTAMRTFRPRGSHAKYISRLGRMHPAVRLASAPFMALRLSGLLGVFPRATGRGGEFASRAQVTKFCTSPGIRSAAAAEKLESSVAPRLQDDLGYKPTILIETDIENLDTMRYLEDPDRHLPDLYESLGTGAHLPAESTSFDTPQLRESVIAANRSTAMQILHFTVDHTYMDQVCEFRFGDGENSIALEETDDSVSYEKQVYHIENELLADDTWSTDADHGPGGSLMETSAGPDEQGDPALIQD